MMLMLMLSNLVLHVFVPLSSFNVDVLLHTHALYVCTCVLAVYQCTCIAVCSYIFYFLIAYLFLLLAYLIRLFFHFVLVTTTTATATTATKTKENLNSCRLLRVDFFSVDRNTHTYFIQFRYSYNK